MSKAEIYLTQNEVALVSLDDYAALAPYKWRVQRNKNVVYAVSDISGRKVFMHRMITGCPPGLVVDHENGNGLHNWRENLRVTTRHHNQMNFCGFGVCAFRGVTRHKNKFRARFGTEHLGLFKTPEEAAVAYDERVLKEFGDFAWLNFPALRPSRVNSVMIEDDVPF